jgi:hypothetical protein
LVADELSFCKFIIKKTVVSKKELKMTTTNQTKVAPLSTEELPPDSLLNIHWSAVFAGLFVTFLTYFILMSLGLAVGASAFKNVLEGDSSMRSVGSGASIWTLISVLVSLFMGSYISGRVSGWIATRIGYVQGAVITALFFTVMMSQAGIALGMLGKGITNLSGAALSGATQLGQNPRITTLIEDSLTDLEIGGGSSSGGTKNIEGVASGLLSRLMRGDTDSAVNFLAAHAGMSRAEASSRIQELNEKFKSTLVDIGRKTSDTAAVVGWSAFITFLLGSIAAMLGGATGAQVNIRRPLDKADRGALRQHPAYT